MTAIPAEFEAPALLPGTPVLLMPTERFPTPQAGYVRPWPADVTDEVRKTRVPVWLVGDALTDYVAFPHTVVAL